MPTMDIDGTAMIKTKNGKKLREDVIIALAQTGQNLYASAIIMNDFFGGTEGPFAGKTETRLYKGTSAGTLVRATKWNPEDGGDNLQIVTVDPVAAGLDMDNGSSGLNTTWSIDVGEWTLQQEFTGNIPDNLSLGIAAAGSTVGPALFFVYVSRTVGMGRVVFEQKITVNA